MVEEQEKLLDHEYDGIRELDNNLPTWWLWLFYITIIISVVYMLYYHVFHIGYSSADQYRAEIDPTFVRAGAAEQRILGMFPEYHSPLHSHRQDLTPWQRARAGGQIVQYVEMTAESDTATYVAVTDPARLDNGREIFVKNCAQCHGSLGEGGIGPNLTDRYWIHGTDMDAVAKSVKFGYPAKGMIPWRGVLSPDQIINVASYALTLKGTNPPSQKEPQGELIAE
jgi:cytochrome c oxidase cbb3-type subunit 3